MTVQDETTRTPGKDDGDAPVTTETTGTPGSEGRDAQPKDDLTKVNLEWKTKAETLNALFAQYGVSSVAELNERLAQSPAAPADTRTTTDDDETDWPAIESFAAKGDPVAKGLIRQRQREENLVRGISDAFTARDIPDATERQQAVTHLNKNRHRLGDLSAALAEVRTNKLTNENAKLRDELKRLQKAPDPDVVNAPSTHGREITSSETQTRKKMRESEFDGEIATLKAQGRHRAAMTLMGKLQSDEIELTPG